MQKNFLNVGTSLTIWMHSHSLKRFSMQFVCVMHIFKSFGRKFSRSTPNEFPYDFINVFFPHSLSKTDEKTDHSSFDIQLHAFRFKLPINDLFSI